MSIVLIAGAATGIGRYTALALAAAGDGMDGEVRGWFAAGYQV